MNGITKAVLLALCALFLDVSMYSQNIGISVSNKTIKQVIEIFSQKTGYSFVYDTEDFQTDRVISLDLKSATLDQAIQAIIKGQELDYVVKGKSIILKKAERRHTIFSKLSGNIVDENDAPVIGVVVQVKNTDNASVTDAAGRFILDNVAYDADIVISCLGYETMTLKAYSVQSHQIVLVTSAQILDELVVVGYGVQKKVNMTGSVAKVSAADLVKTKSANVANALVGRLPGMRAVQRSGAPGQDSPELDIRGYGNPLMIVDGVERPFQKMDPNDIESISILKDATASVYGSKGANGVILVTTKKGVKGKPVFEYSGWAGMQMMTRFPDVYNSYEYAIMKNEASRNEGQNAVYTEEQIEKFRIGAGGDFYKSTDWIGTMTRKTAPQTSHNFSVKGGTDISKYYVSFSIADQQSFFRSNDWKDRRYNMHVHLESNLGHGLTAELLVNGQYDKINLVGGPALFGTMLSYKPFGLAYYKGEPVGPCVTMYKETGYVQQDERSINTSYSVRWDVPAVKGLFATAKFSYDYSMRRHKNFNPAYPYRWEFKENGETYKRYVANLMGRMEDRWSNYIRKDLQVNVGYQREINEHDVSAVGIYQITNGHDEWMTGAKDMPLRVLPYLQAGIEKNKFINGSEGSDLLMAAIARLDYSYHKKYMIEAIFRADATSGFSPDSRWGFFPSVSLGWNIAQEDFFKDNVGFIKNFKIRASYGRVGDRGGVSAFDYMPGYLYPSGRYIFTPGAPSNGMEPKGVINKDLTWFVSNLANVGVDLGCFDNRLKIELDFFRRDREGLLGRRNAVYPQTFGSPLPFENLSSDMNFGTEVAMSWKDNIGDFNYGISGNFTLTRSRMKYNAEITPWAHQWENYTGNPNNRYKNIQWGYNCIGQFQSMEEILSAPDHDGNGNKTLLPGDLRFEDLNGNGIIDGGDSRPISVGNTPYAYYAFSLNLSYKGFDFDAFFQGAGGHNLQLGNAFIRPFMGDGNGMRRWYKERSHKIDFKDPTSDWVIGKFPAPRIQPCPNNERPSNRYICPGDYLRLKNLEIGYSLPESALRKTGLKKLRFFINGNNLLTFTRGWMLKNIDPESGSSDSVYYPQARTLNAGVNLSF